MQFEPTEIEIFRAVDKLGGLASRDDILALVARQQRVTKGHVARVLADLVDADYVAATPSGYSITSDEAARVLEPECG